MNTTSTSPKSGIYSTIYGNACRYRKGNKSAYDLDMGEQIPLEMIDFNEYIRPIDPTTDSNS